MTPINIATNETSPSISNTFLREKYSLTEEYAKNHPEDFAKVLSAVRCTEETLQIMDRLEEAQKEVSNGLIGLREDSKILRAQQVDLIELEKKNTEALQNLVNSSSEMREMTSNIANFAKRFFNPVRNGVRNGFYFLTRQRDPAAVLPRENQLAIEYTPENTISNTDPINPSSVDEKKPYKFIKILYGCGRIICFIFERAKNLLVFIYKGISNLLSKINLWFRSK